MDLNYYVREIEFAILKAAWLNKPFMLDDATTSVFVLRTQQDLNVMVCFRDMSGIGIDGRVTITYTEDLAAKSFDVNVQVRIKNQTMPSVLRFSESTFPNREDYLRYILLAESMAA